MIRTFTSGRPGRLYAVVGLLFCVLIATGVALWWWQRPPSVNALDVYRANNLGIGQMEQFNYDGAVAAFKEVRKLDPKWLPGRINLGIALLNKSEKENLEEARTLFEEILKDDPNNPYGHFCLGIIISYESNPDETKAAAEHFAKVSELDNTDPAAWYWQGRALPAGSPEAAKCFQRAHELDPTLRGPIYAMSQDRQLRAKSPEKAKAYLDEFTALMSAELFNPMDLKYTQMGKYADVIGRTSEEAPKVRTGPLPLFSPAKDFSVILQTGTRWANKDDIASEAHGELRTILRQRFGGVMVLLDYNRDGKSDIFLVGAVVRKGKVNDLLLRNDGNGRFTDVTEEAGLGGPRPSVGCCIADFNNDGYPDLLITGIGEQKLFLNSGQGKFIDVTEKAGLEKVKTVCLGAAFVDLDQDGDLDLVIAQYATPEAVLGALKSSKKIQGAGLAVFLNIGEAIPVSETAAQWTGGCSNLKRASPALSVKFIRTDKPPSLLCDGVPAVCLAAGDFDLDHDLDLIVLGDGSTPAVIANDRLLRFRRTELPSAIIPPGRWNGALVLDANHDQRSDIFVIGPEQKPVLLLNQRPKNPQDATQWFQPGIVDSPPLLQAMAIDVDLDGWTDIIGLSAQGRPVLLHNAGGRLVRAHEGFGLDSAWPKDVVGVTSADFNDDGYPDLMVWSESEGIKLYESQGNGNHGLKLEVRGHRRVEGNKTRCNEDGFGVWVVAQARDLWTGMENTTLSAGLGQSQQPLFLGLGRYTEADVVRLLWPDITVQAEFNQPAGQMCWIEQANRMTISCPVLFAWNGRRFEFVTDFLGAGSMGESQADGGHRPPRPEESVKIEAHQLVPRDGYYTLKIAEPMDEVTYLDRLQFLVVDHPMGFRVYPDERFSNDAPPTQDLLASREEIYAVKACDHHGKDVTTTLRNWDRDTVNSFARRSWMGYAEDHWVELDFGDRLAKFDAKAPLVLCLAGFTEYPYPESIWAATQAKVDLVSPVLEKYGADGKWSPIIPDMGFPAGMPRMMTVDVTGKLVGPTCKLRIRSNMEVYWDQIFVAPLAARVPYAAVGGRGNTPLRTNNLRLTSLEVASASLGARGYLQEHSPDGRKPSIYDYNRLESVPYSFLAGRLTRLGDVSELLRERDDRFAIFGPGDEVTVQFDARYLPPLPEGWTRDFVLRTWGYCKDCSPFTASGDTIEPLPFHRMSNYPYGPDEHYPRDALHDEYQRKYNTRKVGRDKPTVGPRH